MNVSCALRSLCGKDATGEWVTTADVTTERGQQTDAELLLCHPHAELLGLTPQREENP